MFFSLLLLVGCGFKPDMRSPIVIEQGVRFVFEFDFFVDATSQPASHDDDPTLTPNLARVML